MAPRRKSTPSYLPHRQSGRGRAVWTDPAGVHHQRLLPGKFESEESRKAFGKLILELSVSPQFEAPPGDLTIVELANLYRRHAELRYLGPDGKPTSELCEVKSVLRVLLSLYEELLADDFGPIALKAVRQQWVNAGLSRSECNRRTNLVRRIFRWAVSEELVAVATYHALTTVSGLERGRTPAKENEPIKPVADATVDATLPYLSRVVRAMVETQRRTGMRPGEVCIIRRADIDTSGPVWLYRPHRHKNTHRGTERAIAIGPRAQEVLRPFLRPDLGDYLFDPREADAEHRAAAAAKRKTPRWPSHIARNAKKKKTDPERSPKEHYTAASYARSIRRAIEQANVDEKGKAAKEKREPRLIEHWSPNQLRHSFATAVRKQHELEAAQVLLGHSRADVTQIYAERNEALAVEIAAKIG